MSVLVTGGAGFVGSHLVAQLLLATDRPVVILDVAFGQGDLLRAMRGPADA